MFSAKDGFVHIEDSARQRVCVSFGDFYAAIDQANALQEHLRKRQAIDAEINVVPLCALCIRHNLPRD